MDLLSHIKLPKSDELRRGSCYALAFPVALRRRVGSVAMSLCVSFNASALPLTLHQRPRWHVNQFLYLLKMQMHAKAGVDADETPHQHGRIKGATKAKSECVRFLLTLT